MITEIDLELPQQVTDDDGDVWTRAEDGRYSLGTAIRKSGETTLAHVRRNYGLSY